MKKIVLCSQHIKCLEYIRKKAQVPVYASKWCSDCKFVTSDLSQELFFSEGEGGERTREIEGIPRCHVWGLQLSPGISHPSGLVSWIISATERVLSMVVLTFHLHASFHLQRFSQNSLLYISRNTPKKMDPRTQLRKWKPRG